MNLHDFPDYLRHNRRYSAHTVLAYENDLQQFSTFLIENGVQEISEVQHLLVRSWVVNLMESGQEARSVNRKISSLRSFFKYLKRQEIIKHDPMSRISGPKTGKKLPAFIDEDGTQVLFGDFAPGDDFDSWRTYIILETF